MVDALKPSSAGSARSAEQQRPQPGVSPTTSNASGGGGQPVAAEPLSSSPGKYSPQAASPEAVRRAAGGAGSSFQPAAAAATRAPTSLSLNSPQLASFKFPQWLDGDANGRVDLSEARVKHAELRGQRIRVEQREIAPNPGVTLADMRRDEATLAGVIQHLEGGSPPANGGASEPTGRDSGAIAEMGALQGALSNALAELVPTRPPTPEQVAADQAREKAEASAMARLKALDESLGSPSRSALGTDGNLADPNHWYAQVFDIKAGLEAQGPGMNHHYGEQLKEALPEPLVMSPEKAKALRDGAPPFDPAQVDLRQSWMGNDTWLGRPPQAVEVRGLLDGPPDGYWAQHGKSGATHLNPSLNGTFFRVVPALPGDQSRKAYYVPMTAEEVRALRTHLEGVAKQLETSSPPASLDEKQLGRLGRLLSADSAFMKALRDADEHGNVPAMLR